MGIKDGESERRRLLDMVSESFGDFIVVEQDRVSIEAAIDVLGKEFDRKEDVLYKVYLKGEDRIDEPFFLSKNDGSYFCAVFTELYEVKEGIAVKVTFERLPDISIDEL